jgi:hypothetical protein
VEQWSSGGKSEMILDIGHWDIGYWNGSLWKKNKERVAGLRGNGGGLFHGYGTSVSTMEGVEGVEGMEWPPSLRVDR